MTKYNPYYLNRTLLVNYGNDALTRFNSRLIRLQRNNPKFVMQANFVSQPAILPKINQIGFMNKAVVGSVAL